MSTDEEMEAAARALPTDILERVLARRLFDDNMKIITEAFENCAHEDHFVNSAVSSAGSDLMSSWDGAMGTRDPRTWNVSHFLTHLEEIASGIRELRKSIEEELDEAATSLAQAFRS